MLERVDQFVEKSREFDQIGERKGWLHKVASRAASLGFLFYLTVLIPTLGAAIYFFFMASDVYVSEARFVVRSPSKSATSGIGLLIKNAGFASSGDEVYAAQDFLVSRDALAALNRDGAFRKAYGSTDIAYADRFGTGFTGSTFEDLFKYFKSKVKVEHEGTGDIVTLTVRAYAPRDAQHFNERLLEMAEHTVNRLTTRGRQDLIRFAQGEVSAAKEAARAAALALSEYRNRKGVVDPEKQAAVQLQMVAKLQDELIATKTQHAQLRAFTPRNPQISVLEVRIGELAHEIDVELGKVAGDRRSLAVTAAQYQRLFLESQFADRQLASAMASLEDAQNEARRKQAYVERIIEPNMPDDALEPRRWRAVLATLALGLVAWGILTMLLAGVREHRD